MGGTEGWNRSRRGGADRSLVSEFFGGPLDGKRTADWPPQLSGKSLHRMTSKTPLAQPASGSVFAVYVCTSKTQVDGYWRFEFSHLAGPNGERLVAAEEHMQGSDEEPRP